jgi:hypothetical protein
MECPEIRHRLKKKKSQEKVFEGLQYAKISQGIINTVSKN